jgi:hypothetical protein
MGLYHLLSLDSGAPQAPSEPLAPALDLSHQRGDEPISLEIGREAFGEWFGASEVCTWTPDGRREPVVMAHGTPYDFTTFRKNDDYGIWFGSKDSYEVDLAILDEADQEDLPRVDLDYHERNEWEIEGPNFPVGARTIPVFLRIERPADLAVVDPDPAELVRQGFDGAIQRDPATGEIVCAVVLDPGQIKSVFNAGTFDRNTPDIRS